MKNVLIVSGHPELDTSIANQTILSEVAQALPEAEIRRLDTLYPNYQGACTRLALNFTPLPQDFKLPGGCAEVKPKFAFFQEQRKRFAIDLAFGLNYMNAVPKVLAWIYEWVEDTALWIKAGITGSGALLWLAGNFLEKPAEAEQEEEEE